MSISSVRRFAVAGATALFLAAAMANADVFGANCTHAANDGLFLDNCSAALDGATFNMTNQSELNVPSGETSNDVTVLMGDPQKDVKVTFLGVRFLNATAVLEGLSGAGSVFALSGCTFDTSCAPVLRVLEGVLAASNVSVWNVGAFGAGGVLSITGITVSAAGVGGHGFHLLVIPPSVSSQSARAFRGSSVQRGPISFSGNHVESTATARFATDDHCHRREREQQCLYWGGVCDYF